MRWLRGFDLIVVAAVTEPLPFDDFETPLSGTLDNLAPIGPGHMKVRTFLAQQFSKVNCTLDATVVSNRKFHIKYTDFRNRSRLYLIN